VSFLFPSLTLHAIQEGGNTRATRKRGRDSVATQVIAELQPWIEREKAEHIKRAVRMAKRGFERIERLWDEQEAADCKAESLTAATLDKHDAIIRRNLGMNETSAGRVRLTCTS